jgi:hypothetical protein
MTYRGPGRCLDATCEECHPPACWDVPTGHEGRSSSRPLLQPRGRGEFGKTTSGAIDYGAWSSYAWV